MSTISPSALRRLPLRQLVCLVFLLSVAAWVAGNWPVILAGLGELRGADRGWLLAAVLMTAVCWVPICLLRQGTVVERLPVGRLLASQIAAGSANHLLPAGLGAHMVTLRFLRRRGIPAARACAALALYSLVQPVGRYGLLLALLAARPGAAPLGGPLPAEYGVVALLLLAGGLALVALVLWSVRPLRGFVLDLLRSALTDARALHTRPARVLALWGGAFAFPALQGCVLVAVARAVGMPVPAVGVVLAYLAASVVAGIVPTPGGIGSIEAALLVALVGAGSPVSVATAAVLGFRIVTVWLPLLPGALVLAALVRRKVL
ncbi:YbhN family protein [Streptomyces sp. NPDC050560]|uniref:YbhN family protein n=1 Tax=Streptomyces sp. NPDC050560 TaxID=3365630 RepID=UPI00378FA405